MVKSLKMKVCPFTVSYIYAILQQVLGSLYLLRSDTLKELFDECCYSCLYIH